MLSGDNGLLKRAGQAKDDTVVGQEKEQVELAYISAAVKKLGDNVDKDDLQDELDLSVGENKTIVTGTGILKVKFEDTKNQYVINQSGIVEKYIKTDPTPVYAHVCDTDNDGIGETLVLSSTEDIEGYNITNDYGLIQERTNKDYSFYGTHNQKQIKKVVIYNKISPTSTAYWFTSMLDLETIENIKNLDTSNIVSMEAMFKQCKSLKNIDVGGFDTSSVLNMMGMFDQCESLTDLDVSRFDTSNTTNMDSMFHSCKKLESLDLSNFNTEKVTSIGRMFSDCNNLTNIDVSSFNTTNVTDMARLFSRMQ